MILLKGKPLAEQILRDVRLRIDSLGRTPVLRVICEDTNEPYYKGICKDAAFCGVEIQTRTPDQYLWQDDKAWDGVISLCKDVIPPHQLDLDGGDMLPCTADATICLLDYYDIPIERQNVCVIGRSERVGAPLAKLMTDLNATVTVCHSYSKDVQHYLDNSDIVVSCVGDAEFDDRYSIKPTTVLVDIGGDFLNTTCNIKVPFIGGVGPVTRAILMQHVYEKARYGG